MMSFIVAAVILLGALGIVLLFCPLNNLHQKALDEKEHRERSDEISKTILPFISDKERFTFLSEALEGYFDFQRAIEIKNMIDDAKIIMVATSDTHKISIYHEGKLIKEI